MQGSENSRTLVIGAGLMGASAARSLAERGHEVTVVERDVPASASGSSHGSARIFRYGYPDPFYVDLVARSRPLFTDLEERSGTRLITPSGSLDMGAVRRPRELADRLAERGIEHELLSAQEAQERWPGIVVEDEVLWHPGAGVIDAQRTVEVQLELAQAAGARVLDHWEAAEIRRTATGWSVRSSTGGTIDAQRVVIAAGGWLPALLRGTDLPAGIAGRIPPIRVTQENAYHFPYRDGFPGADGSDAAASTPGAPGTAWPTFIRKDRDLQVYSLPGGRDAGFRGQKIAEFLGGSDLPDASAQTGTIDPRNRERIIEHVRRTLPGLVPEPYAETTCLFTMLPGEDFLVDEADGLVIASPCSGHGAKFAPLIGELIADLAGGAQPLPRFRAPALSALTLQEALR